MVLEGEQHLDASHWLAFNQKQRSKPNRRYWAIIEPYSPWTLEEAACQERLPAQFRSFR